MSGSWMIVVAIVAVAAGGACYLARLVIGPSLADRVVALDGLVVTIVAGVLLNSIRSGRDWFLDGALVLAFVGFLGTIAGARFIERRGG